MRRGLTFIKNKRYTRSLKKKVNEIVLRFAMRIIELFPKKLHEDMMAPLYDNGHYHTKIKTLATNFKMAREEKA